MRRNAMSGEQVDLKKALEFFKENGDEYMKVFRKLLKGNPGLLDNSISLDDVMIPDGEEKTVKPIKE